MTNNQHDQDTPRDGCLVRFDAICKKMDEREKTFNFRFDAVERALNIAKAELDRRLEGMNEFRNQLSNQAGTFISKREAELLFEKLEGRIKPIEQTCSQRQGSSKWSDHIITVLLASGVMLFVHYVFKF